MKKDLGEELDNIEGMKDKKFSILGVTMTPTTLTAALAALGSVVGMLYGGFTMYQKIESIAGIEPEAIFAELEKVNTRIDGVEEDADDMKGDIKRAEQTADDAYRFVKDVNKEMNDELRAFRKDVKEIENTFVDKLQKALNNPLSDM